MKQYYVLMAFLCLMGNANAQIEIHCPETVDLGCNPVFREDLPPADPSTIRYKSACDGKINFQYKDDLSIKDQTNSLTRTWTLTDDCGSKATCQQTFIWINDTKPPVFHNCIDDLVLKIEYPCNPDLDDYIPKPDATKFDVTDNAGEVHVFHKHDEIISKSSDCLQVLQRTYEAVDACGNTTQCHEYYRWYSPQFTLFLCPPDKFLGCNPDLKLEFAALDRAFEKNVKSNCKYTIDIQNSSINVVGCTYSLTRKYTVYNLCDEEEIVCYQQVSWIEDIDAPVVVSGPEDWDLGCNPSHIPGPDTSLFQVDDCSHVFISHYKDQSLTSKCQQYITRYYKITDACGNENLYSHLISWKVDTEAPQVSCPAPLDLGCNPASIPAPDTSIIKATDACGIASIQMVASSILFDPVHCTYSLHRTYEVTDYCGNSTTCDHDIFWKENDQIPYIIQCPADTFLGAHPDPMDFITSPQVQPFYVQAYCSTPTTWSELGPVQASGCIYSLTKTYFVEDDCGNINSCDQVYYWVDTSEINLEIPEDISLECYEDLNDFFPAYAPGDTIDSIPCAGIYLIFTESGIDPILDIGNCIGWIDLLYEIVGPDFSVPHVQHIEWDLNLPYAGCHCIDDITLEGRPQSLLLDNRPSEEWNIYPNPAKEFIFLERSRDIEVATTVKILNITGQEIRQEILQRDSGSKRQIDISHFDPGIYFVKIGDGKPLKFVKQ